MGIGRPHDQHRMDARAIEDLLYHRSGLLGVSDVSSDMRTLLASDAARAREAIDLFVYRIGRELGSLAAALGGLHALVFTGGIGENAHVTAASIAANASTARSRSWQTRSASAPARNVDTAASAID
jgi:acetate kinase